MRTDPSNEFPFPAKRYYRGDAIPPRVIQRFARAIAARFHPDKIILFGSHAYGTPHQDSDVDLLVVMPARNQLDQAYKIRLALTAPFALDLIVRTPKEMAWRLEEGESFLTEIVSKGKVLYEKVDARVGKKGRGRLPSDDDPARCEGIAGQIWFENAAITRKLSTWPEDDEAAQADWAREGNLSLKKARGLRIKSRGFSGVAVRSADGKRWGVLLVDSLTEAHVMKSKEETLAFYAKLLAKLV